MVVWFRFVVNSVGMDLVLFIVTWFDVSRVWLGLCCLFLGFVVFVCWFIVCSCGLTCVCISRWFYGGYGFGVSLVSLASGLV